MTYEEKLELLNQQEKKEIRAQRNNQQTSSNDLIANAEKNSLLRIKEARAKTMEDMVENGGIKKIKVSSYDGYEAAYFYQVVNAGNSSLKGSSNGQMNLLLMNKFRSRKSYRTVDRNSVTAKVFLVKPKQAKPGFSLQDAKVIRQVSTVRLSAEDKKVIKLPVGFYMVTFVGRNGVIGSEPITLTPQHNVSVSAEDLRGLNYTSEQVHNYAFCRP